MKKNYTIKNHDSGKTYKMKANSFKEAKKMYETYLADSLTKDSYIDVDMIGISEDGVYDFAKKYKLKVARIKANRGMTEVKFVGSRQDLINAISSKTLGFDKSDADWLIEDSLTKDAISTQKVEDILKKVGLIRRKHYGISSGNYITFDDIPDYDKKNALTALRRAFGEKNVTYTRDDDSVEIVGFVKDAITKDSKGRFEAIWYSDEELDNQHTKMFETEKEAMDFYRKNKGKAGFHGWWITERRPDGNLKRDLVMDTLTTDSNLEVETDGNEKDLERIAKRFNAKLIYNKWSRGSYISRFAGSKSDLLRLAKHIYGPEFNEFFGPKNEYGNKESDLFTNKTTQDSFTKDANIAQLNIKNTYLPEDVDADNIKYIGFSDERKISFYQYGENFYAFYDLENKVVEVDVDEVQRILRKNILGETVKNVDEGPLVHKEGDDE